MKHIILSLFIGLLLVAGADAGAKKKFGKELTVTSATKVSDIIANPEKWNGKRVLVTGPVVDVCKHKGCWIKIGSDKEFESIRFKVEDGVIVFPQDIKGKKASAEGVVSVKKISVEDQIAAGEAAAKEEGTTFDKSTVTGVKVVLQIKGEGAQVDTK